MPVEFIEECGVCGAAHSCWGWRGDEKYVESPKYECTGVVCDFADSKGCFKHYCKGCFEKHRCGAYKGAKK